MSSATRSTATTARPIRRPGSSRRSRDGDVDVAAVWGPLAGYFAQRSAVPLRVVPITETEAFAPLLFQFDIAIGVRKQDKALKDRLDEILARDAGAIRALLVSYGVPLVTAGEGGSVTP